MIDLWISVGEGHGFRPDASPASGITLRSPHHTPGDTATHWKGDHREYVNSSGTVALDASQIIDPTASICGSEETAFFFDATGPA
jgi:hypothetical protein